MGYCTLQDIRDEGFADPPYTDARVEAIIVLASEMIDAATGQWFEPRDLTISLDGDGTKTLRLEVPIIAITSVTMDEDEVELTDLVVYNRHVTQNLRRPDDRRYSRIEWNQNLVNLPGYRMVPQTDLVWTAGQQNVVLEGTFGYTDYDGTDEGKTPPMLVHLCKLLVMRELEFLYDPDAREDYRERHRATKYKTRDQEISLSANKISPCSALANGMLTGDPSIDMWIKYFRVPAKMATV